MDPTQTGPRPTTTEPIDDVVRPPDRFWRQSSVVIMEIIAVLIAGGGFAAYFGMSGDSSDLAAGAAFGLAAAIGIGGLFTTKDQWELSQRLYALWRLAKPREQKEQRFDELRAVNGFFLGYNLANSSSEAAEDLSGISYVRSFCADLDLPLSVPEWELLGETPSSKEQLGEIVDMVRSRVEQYAPQNWFCFFQLGSTVVMMTDTLEAHRSLVSVRSRLEELTTFDAIQWDQRYFPAVQSLLAVLPAGLPSPSTNWSAIAEQVNEILISLPEPEPTSRIAPFAVPVSDWFWVTENDAPAAARFVGDGSVLALPDGVFELHNFSDRADCTVRFDDSEWSCSVHPAADATNPCPEIELVFDMTDGGQPVTEARVVLVRSVPVSDEAR